MKLRRVVPAAIILATILLASSPAKAAVDPYLNNAYPTPGRAIFNGAYFDPMTVSNQVPYVVSRGYGRCLFVSSRWDEAVYNGEYQGSVIATARQVVDDGACTGPNIGEWMRVETVPVFNDTVRGFGYCHQQGYSNVRAEGSGPQTAWLVSVGCGTPGASYGPYGFYSIGPAKGNYRQFTVITTLYGQWATSPVNHWIY